MADERACGEIKKIDNYEGEGRFFYLVYSLDETCKQSKMRDWRIYETKESPF